MKKKIKDLTDEEIRKMCENRTLCEGCPFYSYNEHCFKLMLYEEVEVDD